jgi:hypothetical protein
VVGDSVFVGLKVQLPVSDFTPPQFVALNLGSFRTTRGNVL